MARRTTLVKLLDDLRAECRLSLNPAHNPQNRDTQIKALQRKQEFFWNDFAWPHLRVERFIELAAGQRFYDMPEDLDIDRITKAELRVDTSYVPLPYGIDAEHYTAYDSELDVRSWPIQRVKISEDEQLEVWPIPDQNFDPTTLDGKIKLTGIKRLSPLIADSDRADLDDRLLVLHCAAEYLGASGAKDAQIKLDQANALYLKLRGNLMPRKTYGGMFGTSRYAPTRPRRAYATWREES